MIENEPLSRHTSWRIGGPARYYKEVATPDTLAVALRWARARDLPVLLLGSGTNVLVRDAGFAGLVLRYVARDWHPEERVGNEGILYAKAGAPIAGIARRTSILGWKGLEWAEGLPGTVGGAIYGNSGCYGGDIASIVQQVWLLVGDEIQVWRAEQMQYTYRSSVLKATQQQESQLVSADQAQTAAASAAIRQVPFVILAAELRIVRADREELAAMVARIATLRKTKTPWGSSCGSVFKNPTATEGGASLSAGQLIDQAGLKGKRIGGAQISQVHANYIINLGSASSDDVLRLIELTQSTVLREYGIALELEIRIV